MKDDGFEIDFNGMKIWSIYRLKSSFICLVNVIVPSQFKCIQSLYKFSSRKQVSLK